MLGLKVGASEAEPFWTEFLRSLNRRGLRGVKLEISDSHECIKAATAKVLRATWQRCRVHFMRNALAHAGKTQRRMVSAAIGTVFVQDFGQCGAHAVANRGRSAASQVPLAQVCQLSVHFPSSSAAEPHGCWVSVQK